MVLTPEMYEATLVLVSGGADSAILLRLIHEGASGWEDDGARSARARVVPVFVDYGQRAARREHAAAEGQCAALGLPLRRFDMSAVGEAFLATERAKHYVPLPHRNLVVLSLALSYASQIEADAVALAVTRDDVDGYASASREFLAAIQQVAMALGKVAIVAPLLELDKGAVLAEGIRLGVDFTSTYSCMLGGERHCGRCLQCKKRREGARRAGIVEPPGFYLDDARGIAGGQ